MKNKKAFTLIEVMVVMAIIAVLAVLIIGAIQLARRTATETTHRSNAKTIQAGFEGAYGKLKYYPVMGTLAAPVTFTAAAANPDIDVTITLGACSSNAATSGGGLVYSTASTYWIMPVEHTCNAADRLTGDVLAQN